MKLEHLNEENFKQKTEKGLVVVDFFATWCGPCQILGPIMENVADEVENINVFKVDVDENEKAAREFGVMSIPTIVVLKDGLEIDRHVGLMNKTALVDWIKSHYL